MFTLIYGFAFLIVLLVFLLILAICFVIDLVLLSPIWIPLFIITAITLTVIFSIRAKKRKNARMKKSFITLKNEAPSQKEENKDGEQA